MSAYDRLISEIFSRHDGANNDWFEFDHEELAELAASQDYELRNLGDVIYAYRSGRRDLPDAIASTGKWVLESLGGGRYAFRRSQPALLEEITEAIEKHSCYRPHYLIESWPR